MFAHDIQAQPQEAAQRGAEEAEADPFGLDQIMQREEKPSRSDLSTDPCARYQKPCAHLPTRNALARARKQAYKSASCSDVRAAEFPA
jgi:hypothetical protein